MNPKSKKTSKNPTPKTKPSSKKTISAKPTKTKLVSTPIHPLPARTESRMGSIRIQLL